MDPAYPGFAPGSGTPNTPAPAEAPKKPHLYIGNLSPRVTDYMLTEIFAVAGPVVSAKIIQDRNFQHGGFNYGFVEYTDMRSAEQALQTLNGRKIFDAEVRVNWAYQGQANKEDTQHHYHVFVGDLSPEVNDEVLGKAFGAFGSMSEARVMWDMNSGKSRGYGFLSFRDKADAEQAIASMNGEWLGTRAIRVNWANQKTQTGARVGGPGGGGGGPGMGGPGGPGGPPYQQGGGQFQQHHHQQSPMSVGPSGMIAAPMNAQPPMGGMGMHGHGPGHGHGHGQGPRGPMHGGGGGGGGQGMYGGGGGGHSPAPHFAPSPAMSYEAVAAQTPDYNSTVYVGNLIPYTTQADLLPLFQGYGYIVELRMQADRGFAFVKLDTHHNAAMAIAHLQNQLVHGRPIKCSWGKDKPPGEGGHGAPQGHASPQGQYMGQMGYGNQYNYYGNYAYGQAGVPGQPGVAAAQAGHGPDPQGAGAGGQGGWDAAAAAAYNQGPGWGDFYSQPSTTGGAGAGANGSGGSTNGSGPGGSAAAATSPVPSSGH